MSIMISIAVYTFLTLALSAVLSPENAPEINMFLQLIIMAVLIIAIISVSIASALGV